MNNTFARKIIYIALIGILLIPLSLISRPASRAALVGGDDEAGNKSLAKLAQLRDKYELSQAKMMEIDPASETMKLASLGLRGVAVNMLWMQAIEHKKKENWDQMASTLNALIKIQPNFIKVWEYQAHNMSYNISVEFDDYEYRYHWVKKGINFLTEGIPYNYTDHRMTDNLGFFSGMKIGRSDERFQFRRLFRADSDFHEQMREWVEPDSYFTREYEYDNWLLAYQWYDRSRNLVASEIGQQHISDMMFLRKRPMQMINAAGGLQDEFKTEETIQESWRAGGEEWKEYGEREIRNSQGLTFTLESLAELDVKLTRLRAELDEMIPGVRDELMQDVKQQANLTNSEKEALQIPVDERDDEQLALAREANQRLLKIDREIDLKIMTFANKEAQTGRKALRVYEEIRKVLDQMKFIESYSGTVNYQYWKLRTITEAGNAAAGARQSMFDASEMKRRSIFDDEYLFDQETGEKNIIQEGAISLYLDSFRKWKDVLDEFPRLYEGEMADDITDAVKNYYDMIRVSGIEWPTDFPLQNLIDFRAAEGTNYDKLPTTEDIMERESGREDMDSPDDLFKGAIEANDKAKAEAAEEETEAPDETEDPGEREPDTASDDSN